MSVLFENFIKMLCTCREEYVIKLLVNQFVNSLLLIVNSSFRLTLLKSDEKKTDLPNLKQ